MKHLIEIFISVFFVFFGGVITVFASQENVFTNSNDKIIQYSIPGSKEDLVIPMPGGGYLHGQVIVSDEYGNEIACYDSETDPNAITIAQAEQLEMNK